MSEHRFTLRVGRANESLQRDLHKLLVNCSQEELKDVLGDQIDPDPDIQLIRADLNDLVKENAAITEEKIKTLVDKILERRSQNNEQTFGMLKLLREEERRRQDEERRREEEEERHQEESTKLQELLREEERRRQGAEEASGRKHEAARARAGGGEATSGGAEESSGRKDEAPGRNKQAQEHLLPFFRNSVRLHWQGRQVRELWQRTRPRLVK